mgnify:CR=1 FL=1
MSKDKQAVSFALMGRTFRLYFKIMRESGWGRTILYLSTNILTGVLYALNTPIMESLVAAVTNVAQGAGMSVIILPAVLFFLCGAGTETVEYLGMYYQIVFEQRVRSGLMRRLMRAVGRKEQIAFEEPENLESIEKAKKGVEGIHRLCSQYFDQALFALTYFIGMLIYVGLKSPLLAALLFLSLIPLALSNRLIMAQASSLSDQLAPEQRAADYCEKCMTDREYFKETRLLGAYAYCFRRYFGHLRECVRLNRKFTNHETLYMLGSDVLSLVGFAFSLAAMIFELKNGRLNPAGFAALLAGLLRIYSYMGNIMQNLSRHAAEQLPRVKFVFHLLDMPERHGEAKAADGARGVTLDNVHFRYPGAENEAVRGVSLEIQPGETIAIVGENGAGKTTIARLLTGLYLPTEGRVLIGGEDTQAIDLPSATKNASAVFQKFARYRMTLDENVKMSDVKKDAGISAALDEAGLPLDSACFPNGADTMLSREFDGVDLSGGEWQRVAIARGLYRVHGLIVLDEPTAAIDPLEETRVYKRFAEMSGQSTAVIITHRMGSARIADRIVVMDKGRIDDIGTHEALMAKGGLYARMVESQSSWYRSDDSAAETAPA